MIGCRSLNLLISALQAHCKQMDIAAADAIVQEYLLFRGFTHTFKAFHLEKTQDRCVPCATRYWHQIFAIGSMMG